VSVFALPSLLFFLCLPLSLPFALCPTSPPSLPSLQLGVAGKEQDKGRQEEGEEEEGWKGGRGKHKVETSARQEYG